MKVFQNKELAASFPFEFLRGQDFGSGFTPSTKLRVTPAKRLKLSKSVEIVFRAALRPSHRTGIRLPLPL
jgi:hypothetical protein